MPPNLESCSFSRVVPLDSELFPPCLQKGNDSVFLPHSESETSPPLPALWKRSPNLVSLALTQRWLRFEEWLPPRLTQLYIFELSLEGVSLKHIPATLSYIGPVGNGILKWEDLPSGLKSLFVQPSHHERITRKLPISSWAQLPPHLTDLFVTASMLESAGCSSRQHLAHPVCSDQCPFRITLPFVLDSPLVWSD